MSIKELAENSIMNYGPYNTGDQKDLWLGRQIERLNQRNMNFLSIVPEDLLIKILGFLREIDRPNAFAVCKEWRYLMIENFSSLSDDFKKQFRYLNPSDQKILLANLRKKQTPVLPKLTNTISVTTNQQKENLKKIENSERALSKSHQNQAKFLNNLSEGKFQTKNFSLENFSTIPSICTKQNLFIQGISRGIEIVHLDSGKNLELFEHNATVTSLVLFEEFKSFVSGAKDGNIVIWPMKLNKIKNLNITAPILHLLRHDKNLIVITKTNLKILNMKNKKFEKTLESPTPLTSKALVHKDLLITNSENHQIYIWGIQKGILIDKIEYSGIVTNMVAFENFLIIGTNLGRIHIWDLEKMVLKHTFDEHNEEITALKIIKGQLYSGSKDQTIKMWNLDQMRCIKSLQAHDASISALAQFHDRLISGDASGKVIIWDQENEAFRHEIKGQRGAISSLDSTDDGKIISVDTRKGLSVHNFNLKKG